MNARLSDTFSFISISGSSNLGDRPELTHSFIKWLYSPVYYLYNSSRHKIHMHMLTHS